MSNDLRIAFFGTPEIAVSVLNALHTHGLTPLVLITNPDAPQGRKMELTPPPAKVWGEQRSIPVLQPQSLRTDDTVEQYLRTHRINMLVVAAYGKLIPQTILDIPTYGTLNVHPSLLPKFRGASPIRSAILHNANATGVTIMLLDAELDHGPILAQKTITIPRSEWPMRGRELDALLAKEGGELLAQTIPLWVAGTIEAKAQEHDAATFCAKITKEMGEIDLKDDPYQNLLKIRAFDGWPGTFFFYERNGSRMRIKIVDAELSDDGSLKITRIIPEGRNEMRYEDFITKV
jgi:methionyl-tRNA formyltransferase